MGFIILGVVAVYLAIRAVVVYRFCSKNKNLSDKELEDLADDLYFDLDDFGGVVVAESCGISHRYENAEEKRH